MNKKLLIILLTLVYILVLALGYFLYKNLSARISSDPEPTAAGTLTTDPPQPSAAPSALPEETPQQGAEEEPPVPEKPEALPEGNTPSEPGNAPNFTVYDEQGSPVSLSDFLGRPVVINFWATWCPPCRAELPGFNAAAAEYTDIVFMMVDLTDGVQETQDVVRSFMEENGYTFPVYFDTEYSGVEAYEIYSIPLTVFIDANGDLVDSHIGSMSEDVLRGYLDQLLSN